MNCRHAILQHTIWITLLIITGTTQAQAAYKGEPAPKVSSQATWIWYPGDFEIWLSNNMQNRRTEGGSFFPPFWKLDNHYVLMNFHKDVELAKPEQIDVFVEGKYLLKLDGKVFEGMPQQVTIPAG